MKYRYILSGKVNLKAPISNFRLMAANKLGHASSAIRIQLPSDMKLNKCEANSYSTTDDKRTLNELGYDIVIKINGKWVVRNDLKGIPPHKFANELQNDKIYITTTPDGYMTRKKYGKYLNELAANNK